ncbi:copper homeostasis periplasmic binding protein CopC [Collimonas sp. NPDC087041]|uniref:copper homeostasis periplasmic binding protein CopC n=1 Tax=Collimonas sp. NPDC087041 TaxID=3363960 RepID=UPI00381A6391
MTRRIHWVFLVLMTCFFMSGQAWAHAHLKAAQPADKAVVSSISDIELTFSEGLSLKFSGIKVTGPGKQEVALGEAMLMDEGKTLMIPVSSKLQPGSYTVDWHALSVDGHKTNGSYSFVVSP